MTFDLSSFRDHEGHPVHLPHMEPPESRLTPTRAIVRKSTRTLAGRAAKGDAVARLDYWPIEEVEKSLEKIRLASCDGPLLEWLQRPEANTADAVRDVLEFMACQAEDHAIDMALVWRYVKEHELWKSCSNPKWRTEGSFLNSLDGHQTVRICVQFGTSTDAARRGKIRIILENWGHSWYEDACKKGLLSNEDRGAAGLSKGLLSQIAEMSHMVDFPQAMGLWEQVVRERTAAKPGRSSGWRNAHSPHLTPSDFDRIKMLCPETKACQGMSAHRMKRRIEDTDEVLELRSSTGSSSSNLFGEATPERSESGPRDPKQARGKFSTEKHPRKPNHRRSETAVRNGPSIGAHSSNGCPVAGIGGHIRLRNVAENGHDAASDADEQSVIIHTGADVSANATQASSAHLTTSADTRLQGEDLLHLTQPKTLAGRFRTLNTIAPTSAAGRLMEPAPDDDEATTSSIITSLLDRYGDAIQKLCVIPGTSTDPDVTHQRELRRQWLTNRRWASIYAEDEDVLGTGSTSAEQADVWYLTGERFLSLSERGQAFEKPIVVKQAFQDSGMYDVKGYVDILAACYPKGTIDVQDGQTGACVAIPTLEYCNMVKQCASNPEEPGVFGNAINLGRIADADRPLFTRIPRFRLLSALCNRLRVSPGKVIQDRLTDVESCLGFNLLGLSGAFSRPHVDALVGTWVRCLVGSKLWMVGTRMDDEDWNGFAEQGSNWLPHGKARMIVLEKDDVLLMPPGVRIIHSVFTLEPCLMEGGMLWDECNIPAILDALLWVIRNQDCTNEAVALQLPSIIDALEEWLEENQQRLAHTLPSYERVKSQIQALRTSGCGCESRCQSDRCQCARDGRRCTSWCSSHPSSPHVRFKNGSFPCMVERA